MSERLVERTPGVDTRARMIDLAIDLVAERGYEGTSLQMVADAAGVTKAAVYYHFRTKAELLDGILQRLFADGPIVPDAQALRSRRGRLTWAAEQILETLTRERRVLSVVNSDPLIRKHPTFVSLVEERRLWALHAIYGDDPTLQEQAAFFLATSAVHALPQLEALTDDELVDALRPAIYRTLGIPVPSVD